MGFRRNLITGEPILYAPERAERPAAFGQRTQRESASCPFCPGNEADTPPELARIGGDAWSARAFANKYPPSPGAEIIVETPEHDLRFDEIEDAGSVLQLTFDRYHAQKGAAYVALFKNEGAAAGASIPHPHSQIVPLPFLPPRIEKESAAFARAARCPLCEAIETHRAEGLVLAETEAFAWLVPSASSMPFQQWLIPKRHVGELPRIANGEVDLLAAHLQVASATMLKLASAYTWTFVNFTDDAKGHAYVDLFPRLTAIAGLELGTGTFVEIMNPAVSAQRLREVNE